MIISLLSIESICEPPHENTNNLHRRKQSRRSAVTAQLISAFVFAARIVQSFFFLNPKFQASRPASMTVFVSDLVGTQIVGFLMCCCH